eukprot:CAMPEP_0117660726 /NCGR_PEP_ID=MMETSP0804-20121206/7120_1 /TAXON_ID=1074897 /ORGANISM="Tetraselmis astigmatica, Strain CCMP880" /LENGTH=696 /DNA_ID=CAMNT_0005467471 /DNA_START=398 /DNA_END=2488 /DNA_ORIENTATION=+
MGDFSQLTAVSGALFDKRGNAAAAATAGESRVAMETDAVKSADPTAALPEDTQHRIEAVAYKEELRRHRDPHRPAFHVMPRLGWLNDPNGPIYHNGRYHLFYQHLPGPTWQWDFGIVWGHSHSPDLVNWEHEEIALAPSQDGLDSGGCFSGCAVVDADGTPTLLYTGVRLRAHQPESGLPPPNHDLGLPFIESQLAAVAADEKLRQWRKMEEPVLPLPPLQDTLPLTGWRDPFIVQEGGGGKEWVMLMGAGIKGVGGTVLLYRSPDLKSGWRYDGLLCTGCPEWGYMWECPLLVELPVAAAPATSTPSSSRRSSLGGGKEDPGRDYTSHRQQDGAKEEEQQQHPYTHMLCVSPDAPTNPVYYFLGSYNGTTFDLDNAKGPLLLDLGNTVYAPNTTLGSRGQRLLWTWIQETRPVGSTSHRYAGCMSVPRELSVTRDGRLLQHPSSELDKLRMGGGASLHLGSARLGPEGSVPLDGISGTALDIVLRLENQSAALSGLLVRSFGESDHRATCRSDIALLYDWEHGRLEVMEASPEGLDPRFPSRRRAGGALSHPPGQPLELRILLDNSTLEVFASSGEVLTTRVYRGAVPPGCWDAGLSLIALGGVCVVTADVWEMDSIWGHSEWENTNRLLSQDFAEDAKHSNGRKQEEEEKVQQQQPAPRGEEGEQAEAIVLDWASVEIPPGSQGAGANGPGEVA